MTNEDSCEYEVFLDNSEEVDAFLSVDKKKNYMRFFKVHTLTNVKKGDEIYILDASGESNIFTKPKVTRKFDEAKMMMEEITHQYVESNGNASRNIVNNVCLDDNIYSDSSIRFFEKNIQVANHHLILSIHKVKVN